MSKEEWNTYFSSHWNFGGARQDGHIAVFPEELPSRLIKMFSFTNETIFDPFLGSGTTALAARNLNRNSIGYEINPDFIDFYKKKLNVSQFDLNNTVYEFKKDSFAATDFKEEIRQLPYIFHDPHKMDAKVDVKKLKFGSVIDKESDAKREEYYLVKEVINVNTVVLNNGLTVRLIGIKEKQGINGKATDFIKKKVAGHKVFMKYDNKKFDADNVLLCYLYLDNKTFINAHLLKAGLANIDDSMEFKYKAKFQLLSHGEGMD